MGRTDEQLFKRDCRVSNMNLIALYYMCIFVNGKPGHVDFYYKQADFWQALCWNLNGCLWIWER